MADTAWQTHFSASSDDPLQTAVLYDSLEQTGCGHGVPLERIIARIREQQPAPATCPLCSSKIALIANDEPSASSSSSLQGVVTFKYGKQVYRLAVARSPTLPQRLLVALKLAELPTAQSRIAQVLKLDLQKGMKILYKGKVLYPCPSANANQLSKLLLQMNDPSLLVMGTPRPPGQSFSLWLFARLKQAMIYLSRHFVSLLLLGRPCNDE